MVCPRGGMTDLPTPDTTCGPGFRCADHLPRASVEVEDPAASHTLERDAHERGDPFGTTRPSCHRRFPLHDVEPGGLDEPAEGSWSEVPASGGGHYSASRASA